MCGIVHLRRKDDKPAAKMVEKRFQWQKARGLKGFGFVSLMGEKVENCWRAESEERILLELGKMKGTECLFHHRNPTSTPNLYEAAHPIFISNKKLKYDYYFVHNGVVTRPEILKEKHEKDGFKYTTEMQQAWITHSRESVTDVKWNDSESLGIELVLDLENGRKGIAHVDGRIAFIALQVAKASGQAVALFWGRNSGSPLKYVDNDVYSSITSEGKGEDVPEHKLFCYDYELKTTSSELYRVGYHYEYKPPATGYESDYYKNHHWDYDLKKYVPNVPVGFNTGHTDKLLLPVENLTPQWELDAKRYRELEERRSLVSTSLMKVAGSDSQYEETLTVELAEIKKELEEIDNRYHATDR